MPVADIFKTYAAVLSIGDLGRSYGADHFQVQPQDPGELRRYLASFAWRREREAWRYASTMFAHIRPCGNLTLPSHPEWNPDHDGLAVAPLDLLGGIRTFHAYDLASAVEEGASPDEIEMTECFRLVAVGRQPGLKKFRLTSGRLVDLHKEDIGAALIADCEWAEQQHDRPWLKGLTKRFAQVVAFGGLARHDRRDLDEVVEHFGFGPEGVRLSHLTQHPEVPGPHAFLPVAAANCAGARLVLAMAHHKVRELGSEVAACNTDSIVVPCDEAGSYFECPGAPGDKLRHLTPAELQSVLDSFEPLGIFWKIEVP